MPAASALVPTLRFDTVGVHVELIKAHPLSRRYDPENRGEQSWCLAVKQASLPVDRYPYFIYSPA